MAIMAQRDWRYCDKCYGLFFNGHPTNGRCPAGGQHQNTPSGDYALVVDPDGNFSRGILAQRDWRYCDKCYGLFFNGHPTNGRCPAGGQHQNTPSGDYALVVDPDGNFAD